MNEAGSANFAIRMRYKGEERTTELPLTHDMIRQLAFEAELRNMRIGELIGELMVAMLNKDLFQTVLQREEPIVTPGISSPPRVLSGFAREIERIRSDPWTHDHPGSLGRSDFSQEVTTR
jgi:hypothetical protein